MKYRLLLIWLVASSTNLFSQEEIKTRELPRIINGQYQDVRPIISDDGTVLYFTRRLHPENIRGTRDVQDVWMSKIINRQMFAEPVNLGKPYNDKKANDLVRAATTDDSLVFVNTGYKGANSMLALFTKNAEKAQNMSINGYYNKSAYVDFDVNFKLNVIIMAVERKNSVGDQDLYYSIYQPDEQTYSTPLSLGENVNTSEADFAPFLTNDGYTLFFASYGHGGQGGADIFVSQRQTEAWDSWSAPINLGSPINSANEETFVSVDPALNYLYYDSYRAGATNRNIWRAEIPAELKKQIQERTLSRSSFIASANPEMERANKEAMDVDADASSKKDNGVSAAEVPDDLNFFEKIGQKLGMNISKEAIRLIDAGAKGQKINKNVYFKFNAAKVQMKYNSLLKAVARQLADKPDVKVLIEGHTDATGGEDVNIDLSCQRSKNIRQALIAYGVDQYRLEISCAGEERPLATNDDEFEGRELNRRVEFYFY